MWYRDPCGHVFEVTDRRLYHYFCSICNKIYILRSKRSEVVKMLRYRGALYEADSPRGIIILNNRKKARIKQRKRNKKYRETHKVELRNKRLVYVCENRELIRQRVRDYNKQNKNKKYSKSAITKSWEYSYSQALEGLAKLGLGISRKAVYRQRLKLRKYLAKLNLDYLKCSICGGKMDINANGLIKCQSCSYWITINALSPK